VADSAVPAAKKNASFCGTAAESTPSTYWKPILQVVEAAKASEMIASAFCSSVPPGSHQ